MKNRIIIDTDIGDDIDDIFALLFCLCNPQFEIDLIIVSSGDNDYKAKLVASILQELNMTHIKIAKGKNDKYGCLAQNNVIKDFDLTQYQGEIYDGVDYILTKLLSKNHYDVFELGPSNELANYFKKHEELKHQISLYFMGGSVFRGYINKPEPCAEYNVLLSVDSSNYLFENIEDITLLPVDCCYDLIIDGSYYQKLLNSNNKAVELLKKHYFAWQSDYTGGARKFDINTSSSILFDYVVPLYYLRKDLFEVKNLNVRFTGDGKTVVIDGNSIKVVTKLIDKKEAQREFVSKIRGD